MPMSSSIKNIFRSRRGVIAVLVILSLVLVGLWRGFWVQDKNAVALVTDTVVRGDIENLVTATGILQPRDYVDVGAQVSGQLKTLHVEVGSEVKQGDLLAEIDATVYMANVDASRAQLRNQKAQMREREASLHLAQLVYKRQQNLLKESATTTEAVENAEASLTSAKAQLESLTAQIEQTESSLRAEEAKLEYASIYAPMDGTIVSIDAKQGQTLNANQTAPILMRIADLSIMKVKTQVSEADVGKIKAGMAVYFTTLGSDGRRWYSTLERIEPTPETLNNVVLYNALFHVPNESRELMSDMTAQVFFIAGQANNVLTVPASALTYFPVRSERTTTRVNSGESRPASNTSAATNDRAVSGERPMGPPPARDGDNTMRGPRPDFTPLAEGERRARAQVLKSDGTLEERLLVIGTTNRVTAEVKSGVEEGEVVVLKTQRATGSASSQAGQQQRGPMGPPGMMR